MLVIERCHLRVEAMVATPYAAGLSTLVDDEAELGAAVVDFGGGSTTVGVFSGGRLVHIDAIALGGIHVTRDVARGSQRLGRRRRTAEDLVRRLHRVGLRRPGNHHRPPARRRPGSSQPPVEVGTRANHPPAGGGDSRTRARPAQSLGVRVSGRPQTGDDRGGLPADRIAGTGAPRPSPVRRASAGRSASRACRNPARARLSPPRSASWSIRKWPASNISKPALADASASGRRRICGAGRTVAEGKFLRRVRGARRRRGRG